jgi:hypothetical protein
MNDYLRLLSCKHQKRLQAIARSHGTTAERALRNIVYHIKEESVPGAPKLPYFEDSVTIRQIEGAIESLQFWHSYPAYKKQALQLNQK